MDKYMSKKDVIFMGESAFCPHCGARMTEDIDEQKK